MFPGFRLCLTGGLLTGGLLTGGLRNLMTRDVGTSVSARHPDVTALFADFHTK